jgi:hypothetical protein
LKYLATNEKTRKKTRAWKRTNLVDVLSLVNDTFLPSVERRNPGLKVKKSAAGIATLAEVISGKVGFIIYILWIFFCSKYIITEIVNRLVPEDIPIFTYKSPKKVEI